MAANPPVDKEWDVPPRLKIASDWAKVLGLISFVAGVIAACLVGPDKGMLVGTMVAGMSFVFFAIHRVMSPPINNAINVLSTSRYTKDEDRQPVIQGLLRWQRSTLIVLFCFLALTIGSVVWVSYAPVSHWWTIQAPKSVKFANFKYYSPEEEQALLEEAPFLEAIISALTAEGVADGKKFRIAIGTTVPFSHPTPKFRCSMVIDGGGYDATGYAFRKHPGDGRTIYEAVPAEYPKPRSVIFAVPSSERKDQHFVVVLLTIQEGETFPDDLVSVSNLTLVE